MENDKTVVLAGATGALGGRIARELLRRGANVTALVRDGSEHDKVADLQTRGAMIATVNFRRAFELSAACAGASCVVSALSGLRDELVGLQTLLLEAAVAAGVPRFVPSDYCIDYARVAPDKNRNLDLRREFGERLDRASIAATSVLSGMFTHLLAGRAPVIVSPLRRVLYWDDPDQLLDFTTIDDTAVFTAAAALDATTPRFLRIAGDERSARGLAEDASAASGKEFRLLRAGGMGALELVIQALRLSPFGTRAAFPAWQGMQYLRDMFSGRGKLAPLDNGRYPGMKWSTVRNVLARADAQQGRAARTRIGPFRPRPST
jgi:nucleoside-diphosphate-sugar epimerase